jgi:hypothetical protein
VEYGIVSFGANRINGYSSSANEIASSSGTWNSEFRRELNWVKFGQSVVSVRGGKLGMVHGTKVRMSLALVVGCWFYLWIGRVSYCS